MIGVLLLGGCGGSSEEEASVETLEVTTTQDETTEKTTEITTQQETTNSNEQAAVEIEADATLEARVESSAVNCVEFDSQFSAQQFFDFNATLEQRAQLDPEGDGFACSEDNPAVIVAQSAPAAEQVPEVVEQAPTRPPFQPTTNEWADSQRRLAEAQMTDAELIAAQERAAQQRAIDPYMDESYGERQRRLAGQ